MRLGFRPDSFTERMGLALHKVPVPVGMAFFGMPMARGVGVAQRLGVFARLSSGERTAADLACDLGVHERPLAMLLDLLTAEQLLELRQDRYALSPDGRRWLDPASPTYVGTFIEHTVEYWDWWGELESVIREGPRPMQDHGVPAEDATWPVYIRGQYELARLSAGDVARAIPLHEGARSLLDIAGGHGWFAAELCRRHPGLRATVLDLSGSVRVGREVLAEAGMEDRVEHREGDMFTSDLGGPHDGVLLFSILHHLAPDQRSSLLARVRAALKPGGTLAVLDMFRPESGQTRISSAAVFQLFFHLTSGADVLSDQELRQLLDRAGFTAPERKQVRSIPDYRLYTASAAHIGW
jgi:ubiquinone/menaquinone biosynthesis C-methylase UbiE